MAEQTYRTAPPGFTSAQWDEFIEEGFLIVENALNEDEMAYYRNAIDEVAAADPRFNPTKTYSFNNAVERHRAFAEMIDHPRHVGYAYDIYGELLKLHISQVFMRPKHGNHNIWHPDGARGVPYGVFSPVLPMQLKIGYWLTDLPRAKMGNFVYMPGSHRTHYLRGYDTHESLPGERILTLKAGTMTLMHASLWHRVEPNLSDVVRKNIFFAYCPSWVCEADRRRSNEAWLKTLNREQRIIMRSYASPYARTKPPQSDSPLFLDRETGMDCDIGSDAGVQLHRRKRQTWVEKRMGVPYAGPLAERFARRHSPALIAPKTERRVE